MKQPNHSKPGALKQGVQKLRRLRPGQVRHDMRQPFTLVLLAAGEADREALVRAFVPERLDREESEYALARIAAEEAGGTAGIDAGARAREALLRVATPAARANGSGAGSPTVVNPADPGPGFSQLLRRWPQYGLALARAFPPLRERMARELIRAVAGRNAGIAALSALAEVIPTPLSLILALGEMGSDTVLITANQMSLAFQLAAVRGGEVGWRAQSRALLAITAGSLGWRTLAREAVGLVPAGIGLAAKSAIAYSGTVAVGTALWRVPGRRRTAAGHYNRMPDVSTGRIAESGLASRRQTA